MNKLDYLLEKISELEQNDNSLNYKVSLPCSEFSYYDGSDDLSLGKTFTSESFASFSGSSILIMCSFDIEAESSDDFNFSMDYDGFNVLSETKSLSSGVHSLFFMKAISAISDESKSFTFTITPDGLYQHKITNIKYFVWGDIVSSEKYVDVSATTMDGNYAISMVLDNKLLLAEYNSLPSHILLSDFSYFKDSVFSSICYFKKHDGTVGLAYARKQKNSGYGYFGIRGGSETVLSMTTKLMCVGTYMGEFGAVGIAYTDSGDIVYSAYTYSFNAITSFSLPLDKEIKSIELIKNSHDRLMLVIISSDNYAYLMRSSIILNYGIEKIKVKATFSYS